MKVTIKVTEICEKFVDLDLDNVNDMDSAYEAVESIFNDMLSNGEIDLARPDNYSCDWEIMNSEEVLRLNDARPRELDDYSCGAELGMMMTCQRCGKTHFRKQIAPDVYEELTRGWKFNDDRHFKYGWWCPECVRNYTI